jgi:uncharacterized membrane protein
MRITFAFRAPFPGRLDLWSRMLAATDAEPVTAAPRVYLDAEIRPYRSLSRAGFVIVMIVLAGASFTAGVFYVAMGAWPVMGFFGLDVALVWIAFRLSYRQARLVERVRVTADRLDVSREQPSGRAERWVLSPYWTRVRTDDPVRHDSRLELVSRGESLVVGSFLAPRERRRFAERIRAALAAAREERFEPTLRPQMQGPQRREPQGRETQGRESQGRESQGSGGGT